MGLFDSLLNIGKNILKDNVSKEVQNSFNSAISNITGEKKDSAIQPVSTNIPDIPERYNEFPKFSAGKLESSSEKNTPSYFRYTMNFTNISNDDIKNYISTVISMGYVQATSVRYDKQNTYIIIESYNNYLNLVFHIKK